MSFFAIKLNFFSDEKARMQVSNCTITTLITGEEIALIAPSEFKRINDRLGPCFEIIDKYGNTYRAKKEQLQKQLF